MQTLEGGRSDSFFNTTTTTAPTSTNNRSGKRKLLDIEDSEIPSESIVRELKSMEDSATIIHEEMISIRQSEGETQRLNENTAVRMQSFTLLSLAVCAGIAGLQLCHLKTFFQKRHIL